MIQNFLQEPFQDCELYLTGTDFRNSNSKTSTNHPRFKPLIKNTFHTIPKIPIFMSSRTRDHKIPSTPRKMSHHSINRIVKKLQFVSWSFVTLKMTVENKNKNLKKYFKIKTDCHWFVSSDFKVVQEILHSINRDISNVAFCEWFLMCCCPLLCIDVFIMLLLMCCCCCFQCVDAFTEQLL